jgi:hypothetical protein
MTKSMLYSALILVVCTMAAACASDSPPDRQRPGYSYEGVDIGPNPSSQHHRVDEPPRTNDPYSRGYGR